MRAAGEAVASSHTVAAHPFCRPWNLRVVCFGIVEFKKKGILESWTVEIVDTPKFCNSPNQVSPKTWDPNNALHTPRDGELSPSFGGLLYLPPCLMVVRPGRPRLTLFDDF